MPGFGDCKAQIHTASLARRSDVKPAGWEHYLLDRPRIPEMESPEDRSELKEQKKAWKTSQRSWRPCVWPY